MLQVTLFKRPNGVRETITVTKINPDDANWFKMINAKVSMEEDGCGGVIAYADVGLRDEDNEVSEVIQLNPLMRHTCEEMFSGLRKQCQFLLGKAKNKE